MMPFLAPIAGPLIGLGGSLLGGLFGGKKSSSQNTAESALGDLAKAAVARQNLVMPAGQSAIDFYTKLLSGDRTATMETLGPTVQNITSQYSQGRNNILASLGPGGVRDKALATLDAGRVRDVGNLFSTAQPNAADALARIFTGTPANPDFGALLGLAEMDANRGSSLANLGGQLGGILGSILFPSKSSTSGGGNVILSGSGTTGAAGYPGNIFAGGF